MRRSCVPAFLIFFMFSAALHAQRDSAREDFIDAESWLLLEEYNEAGFIYQKLLKQDPDNDNLKYKIGICLLNDPYRKQESIRYLEDASQNINPDYKVGSYKERSAPPDVLFYLGNAFLVNNRLDDALETYERFLKIMDPAIYDEVLVEKQIQACRNAKRLMSMPVDIDLNPVSQEVNTRYAETNPVISGDGNHMAFVTEQPFFDEALYIEKVNGKWTLPMSITSMLGFDENVYPCALNYDGTEMVLYYGDDYVGNLYLSKYKDGFWLPAQKLGEPISTKYWESHGSFSPDGETLYFTSNRKGGYGGLDIYRSTRKSDGNWGEPENLGPTINSRYNEDTPFLTADGKTLFFSSYGHFNMGGYDIFYSTMKENGGWDEPVNLGYPVNTTDDDLFFDPAQNGNAGYESRIGEDSRGRKDLYYVTIYSANNPRMYVVTGVVRTEKEGTDLTTLRMFVIDPDTGDTIRYDIPIHQDGSFEMKLAQGDYMLHFQGEGYEDLIRPLRITSSSDKEGIRLEGVVQMALAEKAPKIFTGEESKIGVKDTLFEGVAGIPLEIPLRLEKGATLVVVVTHDSSVVSRDTLEAGKRKSQLEIIPPPGISKVELEMTDSDGNIHRRTLTVIGALPEPPAEEPPAETIESVTEIPEALAATPLGRLLPGLRETSEGALQEYLLQLDLEKEGITTERELFEHLYEEAGKGTFDARTVDLLLAGTLLDMDERTGRLEDILQINAKGPLEAYLLELDTTQEGYLAPEELLDLLERESGERGYTMGQVREAMLDALTITPAEILLKTLKEESEEGSLKETLMNLDPVAEGITSRGEIFDYLYQRTGAEGFDKEEVDQLLVNSLSMGNVDLLYRKLLENSEGPLKTYLEGLDLEKEGIYTPEDLIRHLEQAAPGQDFTMEDVRLSMIRALDEPLEVETIYEHLIETTDGTIHEILLEAGPLQAAGILTPEDLITAVYKALYRQAYSDKEIRRILNELFPDHSEFIKKLVEGGGETADHRGLTLALALTGGGILVVLLFIFLRRRRKKD